MSREAGAFTAVAVGLDPVGRVPGVIDPLMKDDPIGASAHPASARPSAIAPRVIFTFAIFTSSGLDPSIRRRPKE
jgi:hypothetical protein